MSQAIEDAWRRRLHSRNDHFYSLRSVSLLVSTFAGMSCQAQPRLSQMS